MEDDLLKELFDNKRLAILRLFYEGPEKNFYLREISKLSSVPVASVFRIIKKLVDLELIQQHKVNKFKIYTLNDNEKTRFLGQFVKKQKQVLQVFVSKVKFLEGLENVYVHGKEEKNRANVFIVGQNIDANQVKSICSEISDQFKYRITPLILTKEQFEQMGSMHLYSGVKRVIFQK